MSWLKIVYGEVLASYHDIWLAVLHLYIYALVRIVLMAILGMKQKGCKYLVYTLCHTDAKVRRKFCLYAYSTVKHFNEWKS